MKSHRLTLHLINLGLDNSQSASPYYLALEQFATKLTNRYCPNFLNALTLAVIAFPSTFQNH
jgi:hypothetical protein